MKIPFTIITKIIRNKRDAKLKAQHRKIIEYCLRKSFFKYEDLIPIPAYEYNEMVAQLEDKVAKERADESYKALTPIGYSLPRIYSWQEIVASMKTRIREAYYLNTPCPFCNRDRLVLFCFRTSDESWVDFCGREGYMLICPECLTIQGFVHYR